MLYPVSEQEDYNNDYDLLVTILGDEENGLGIK